MNSNNIKARNTNTIMVPLVLHHHHQWVLMSRAIGYHVAIAWSELHPCSTHPTHCLSQQLLHQRQFLPLHMLSQGFAWSRNGIQNDWVQDLVLVDECLKVYFLHVMLPQHMLEVLSEQQHFSDLKLQIQLCNGSNQLSSCWKTPLLHRIKNSA